MPVLNTFHNEELLKQADAMMDDIRYDPIKSKFIDNEMERFKCFTCEGYYPFDEVTMVSLNVSGSDSLNLSMCSSCVEDARTAHRPCEERKKSELERHLEQLQGSQVIPGARLEKRLVWTSDQRWAAEQERKKEFISKVKVLIEDGKIDSEIASDLKSASSLVKAIREGSFT